MHPSRLCSVCLSVAVFVAALSSAAPASAWEPDTHRSGAGADFYPWHIGNPAGTTLPLVGFANIGVTDVFYIDVYAPFTATTNGRTIGGVGNPTAMFRYAPQHGIARWWIGGGIGAPVASINDDDWQRAVAFSAIANAMYDSHLWIPSYMPLIVTGGADIRVLEFMSLQFSGEGLNNVRVRRRGFLAEDGFELFIQTRAGVEFRDPRTGIGGGGHFRFVYSPTARGLFLGPGDRLQSSIEPFFGWTGRRFFVRFGLIMAIDNPYGPFFEDTRGGRPRVFSQHGTLGGSW